MIDVNGMTREQRRELEDESVVMVRMESFSVPCTVFDTRNRYGNIDLQVQPVGGDGVYWVSSDRCTA